MIPTTYGLGVADVRGAIMRCSKPPPAGWKSNEWTVLGGRQSGGFATISGCGGELYYRGEFVGILADVEFEQTWDYRDPIIVDGEKHPRLTETNAVNFIYVPALWYLVG